MGLLCGHAYRDVYRWLAPPPAGRPGSDRGKSAFPQVRVLALCEAAAHVFWRWRVERRGAGEPTVTPSLPRHLTTGMLLLLWGRNSFKCAHVKRVLGRGLAPGEYTGG